MRLSKFLKKISSGKYRYPFICLQDLLLLIKMAWMLSNQAESTLSNNKGECDR